MISSEKEILLIFLSETQKSQYLYPEPPVRTPESQWFIFRNFCAANTNRCAAGGGILCDDKNGVVRANHPTFIHELQEPNPDSTYLRWQ